MYQVKSSVKIFSFYCGGPSTKKIFFQSEHVSSQIWCQIVFLLLLGVPLTKKFFFQSEHVSSQIWCQNFFLLLWEGGPSTKIFFSSLNMYQAKSGVKNCSLYWGGGSFHKNFFFPVWTCIKPNLVSKIFPFYRWEGGSLDKKFFFQSEHVSSEIRCRNFFLLLFGGIPWQKSFFPSLKIYQAKSGVKIFSLNHKGEVPQQKNFFFFFPVWTCIKPNLVSKIFPFTRGGPFTKNFFFQSEHVSSQIWCQNFFPLLGRGVPLQKNFFPVWTCIKPNLVSKIFPFTGRGEGRWGGVLLTKNFFSSQNMYQVKSSVKIFSFYCGGPSTKKIFFQSEHVSSQIWCQNFFLLLWEGGPLTKIFFSSLNMYQAKSGVKNFSLYQ